jgi:hypothetical protein
MSARIPTMREVHDSKFSLSGGLEVLTSIFIPQFNQQNVYTNSTNIIYLKKE